LFGLTTNNHQPTTADIFSREGAKPRRGRIHNNPSGLRFQVSGFRERCRSLAQPILECRQENKNHRQHTHQEDKVFGHIKMLLVVKAWPLSHINIRGISPSGSPSVAAPQISILVPKYGAHMNEVWQELDRFR
jgi:hypothetical protein